MQVFSEWAESLNALIKREGRKIVVLLDNASSHTMTGKVNEVCHGLKGISLTNVFFMYLPANTTSGIQPMDAGIIAAFKHHYRRHLLRWKLEAFDDSEDIDLATAHPDLKQVQKLGLHQSLVKVLEVKSCYSQAACIQGSLRVLTFACRLVFG